MAEDKNARNSILKQFGEEKNTLNFVPNNNRPKKNDPIQRLLLYWLQAPSSLRLLSFFLEPVFVNVYGAARNRFRQPM